jgi:hypothetical protein
MTIRHLTFPITANARYRPLSRTPAMADYAYPSIKCAFLILSAELYLRAHLIVFNDSTVDVSCTHTTSIKRIAGSGHQPQTNARHLAVDGGVL